MARKTPEEAARTRQRILDAAVEVFVRDGIASATLEQVARQAGVSRGAIYWHFKGKQDLLQSILDEQSHPLECAVPADIGFQAGWQRLREDLGESVSADAPRRLTEIILHKSERRAASEPIPLRLEQLRECFMRRLQRLLTDAVANGELAAELDIPAIGEVFQGCVGGLLFECLQRPGAAARKIAATLDTLLYLLENPPAHLLLAGRGQ